MAFAKRFFILFCAALLFAGFASAVSISAPSSVPENASWVFSVDLEPNTEATVKLNDSEIVKVFSSGAVVPSSASVASAHLYSGDLVVQYSGLGPGTYTLSVESNGSDSKEITVVPILDTQQILSDIDAKVNERLSKFDEVDQQLKNLDVDNKEFWKKLNENIGKVSSLEAQVGTVSSDVSGLSENVSGSNDSLSSKISSLESKVSALEAVENEKQAQLAAEEEARKNSPITGFVGFASDNALGLVMIAVAIIGLGIVFVFRGKITESVSTLSDAASSRSNFGGSQYGRDENNLPISREQEEMANELSGSKKWAAKK